LGGSRFKTILNKKLARPSILNHKLSMMAYTYHPATWEAVGRLLSAWDSNVRIPK
jgi:hypothetical protein